MITLEAEGSTTLLLKTSTHTPIVYITVSNQLRQVTLPLKRGSIHVNISMYFKVDKVKDVFNHSMCQGRITNKDHLACEAKVQE